MSLLYAPGVTSKSITVQIVNDSGIGVTGLVAATWPTVYYQIFGANAEVAITLSDLATITTPWTSGAVYELSGGYYRLDLPNAAVASAGKVKVFAETTGKHLIAETLAPDYPQMDARQWVGTTIPAPTQTGVPITDPHYFGGVVGTFAVGIPSVNATQVQNDLDNLQTVPGSGVFTVEAGVNFPGGSGSAAVWEQLLSSSGFSTPGSIGALLKEDITGVLALQSQLSGGTFTIVSPVAQNGTITIVSGDDYSAADGRQIIFTGASPNVWPNLTGANIVLEVYSLTSDSMVVEFPASPQTPTGTQVVWCTPASVQTGQLKHGTRWQYYLVATLADNTIATLAIGYLTVG